MSWIDQWKTEPLNPILYYKLQGEEDSRKKLTKHGFTVIIQTESQRYLYQPFRHKGTGIVSTVLNENISLGQHKKSFPLVCIRIECTIYWYYISVTFSHVEQNLYLDYKSTYYFRTCHCCCFL